MTSRCSPTATPRRSPGTSRGSAARSTSFYPEDAWHDDMELGGAELALAAQRLGDPRANTWLAQSPRWAGQYLAHDAGKDTINLYDVGALAHADLVRAIRAGHARLSTANLVADLRAPLDPGARRAAADPFRAGAVYTDFDSVPHSFGLVATARLYQAVSGDARRTGRIFTRCSPGTAAGTSTMCAPGRPQNRPTTSPRSVRTP